MTDDVQLFRGFDKVRVTTVAIWPEGAKGGLVLKGLGRSVDVFVSVGKICLPRPTVGGRA